MIATCYPQPTVVMGITMNTISTRDETLYWCLCLSLFPHLHMSSRNTNTATPTSKTTFTQSHVNHTHLKKEKKRKTIYCTEHRSECTNLLEKFTIEIIINGTFHIRGKVTFFKSTELSHSSSLSHTQSHVCLSRHLVDT